MPDLAVKSENDYTVAIICALEVELSAVRGMLDQEHQELYLPTETGDANKYIFGDICGHNVVISCLPEQQGNSSAATVANNLDRTFRSIKWRFMVGIGGGIPSEQHDIRLGDVVVSQPEGTHGGVVQYDLGKETKDGFVLKGFLEPPPGYLRAAATRMRTDHRFSNSNYISEHIANFLARYPHLSEYARPQPLTGPDAKPKIHYGLIASGNSLIKSLRRRDELVEMLGDVLCVEMEAAGIMTTKGCIVIRGISDLADEEKNDGWGAYAAAAAAACAKELLKRVAPAKTKEDSQSHVQRALPACEENYPRDFHHIVQHGNGTQQVGSGNTCINGKGNNVLT